MMTFLLGGISAMAMVLLVAGVVAGVKKVKKSKAAKREAEREPFNLKDLVLLNDTTFGHGKGRNRVAGQIKNHTISGVVIKGQLYKSVDEANDAKALNNKQLEYLEALEQYLMEVRDAGKMYYTVKNEFYGDEEDDHKIYIYRDGDGVVSDRCTIHVTKDAVHGTLHVDRLWIDEKDYYYTIKPLQGTEWKDFVGGMGKVSYKEECKMVETIMERLDFYNNLLVSKEMFFDKEGNLAFKAPKTVAHKKDPVTEPQKKKGPVAY